MLDLAGHYAGSWQDLTNLLHQLAPQTSQTVAFQGRTGGEITITGPARKPELRPVYHGVTAGTEVGWSSGRVYGLELSEASLAPVLLRRQEPVLTIPSGLWVLEKVQIDRDLSRQLLSRFNPIFSEIAQINGEVSLRMDRGAFPLGEGFRQGASGAGRLELRSVRLLPRGLLGRLLELANISRAEPVVVSFNQVDFVIADGPVAAYARVLAGTRIELPIVGTRLGPRIDFSAVDLGGLLREATRKLLLETPARIEDIFRPRRTAPEPPPRPGDTPPTTRPSPAEPGRPDDDVLEGLWDLLGGLQKGSSRNDEEGR